MTNFFFVCRQHDLAAVVLLTPVFYKIENLHTLFSKAGVIMIYCSSSPALLDKQNKINKLRELPLKLESPD